MVARLDRLLRIGGGDDQATIDLAIDLAIDLVTGSVLAADRQHDRAWQSCAQLVSYRHVADDRQPARDWRLGLLSSSLPADGDRRRQQIAIVARDNPLS